MKVSKCQLIQGRRNIKSTIKNPFFALDLSLKYSLGLMSSSFILAAAPAAAAAGAAASPMLAAGSSGGGGEVRVLDLRLLLLDLLFRLSDLLFRLADLPLLLRV